jgi:hypothetical protein
MENMLGNKLGTHWELKGDIVGTNGEPGKNEKKTCAPSLKLKRKKKQATMSACLGSPLAACKFLPKRDPHHFWPGLIPSLAKNTLPI